MTRADSASHRVLRLLAALAAVCLIAVISGCKTDELPHKNSTAARTYAHLCGRCHTAYNPHLMTAAMWTMQVQMMEERMAQSGFPPLTSEQRKTILTYLHDNAGHE